MEQPSESDNDEFYAKEDTDVTAAEFFCLEFRTTEEAAVTVLPSRGSLQSAAPFTFGSTAICKSWRCGNVSLINPTVG